VVLDASAAINLCAAGCADDILRALPNTALVVDAIPAELEQGRHRGRRDAETLCELVAAGLVRVVTLGEPAEAIFESLVIGGAAQTLDDGEAATIAYAVEHRSVAVIDERKAIRICGQRFPARRLGCTVDVFAHPDVLRTLGRERASQAVANALQLARMRVLPHHVNWVVDLIGAEQAALCASLPRSVRGMGMARRAEPVRREAFPAGGDGR